MRLGDKFMAELDLGKIRDEIDIVDKSIIELYEKRMHLCKDVAEYKIANGKQVLDRTREQQKIDRVRELASKDFDPRSVEQLFTCGI